MFNSKKLKNVLFDFTICNKIMRLVVFCLLFISCLTLENHYINEFSVDYLDPSSWSLFRVPNINDTAIINNFIVVIIGSTPPVKNLIVSNGTVLSIYEPFSVFGKFQIIDAMVVIFNTVSVLHLETFNSDVWLMNFGGITSPNDIHINPNDQYYIGLNSSFQKILTSVYNAGTVVLLPGSNLITQNYYQLTFGKTTFYYNPFGPIGNITGNSISLHGKLEFNVYYLPILSSNVSCQNIFIGTNIIYDAHIINKNDVLQNLTVSEVKINVCLN
jgi:hypothetical protein